MCVIGIDNGTLPEATATRCIVSRWCPSRTAPTSNVPLPRAPRVCRRSALAVVHGGLDWQVRVGAASERHVWRHDVRRASASLKPCGTGSPRTRRRPKCSPRPCRARVVLRRPADHGGQGRSATLEALRTWCIRSAQSRIATGRSWRQSGDSGPSHPARTHTGRAKWLAGLTSRH